jgi:uncharacterized flavoprotein (TIGR03862 family)
VIAIVGGGPSGLIAAETLAAAGRAVTVYDRMPSVGRKFLLAGRGGLNLTHSEPPERFLGRYGEAAPQIAAALDAFPPRALTAWAEGLGEPTFVGSSGRVFPRSFKATPLLRAWLRRLDALGVRFALRHRWTGWTNDGALAFVAPDGPVAIRPDATILALGGASWPRLGADGSWVPILSAEGVAVTPLAPANCGFELGWSELFRERFAGAPLKRLALSFDGETIKGEAVMTRDGLEGQAVYGLASRLRRAIDASARAVLTVDLRPDLAVETLTQTLASGRAGDSLANRLRKAAGLSPVAIGLLREATGNAIPASPTDLAVLIKAVPLTLTAARPLDRAISTAGGIAFSELGPGFALRRLPSIHAVGEMLDWEAPTGGYLLQACFSTGVAAAQAILAAPRRA